jgi:hypothetical protein
MRVWLSYDLGLDGDYESLYGWLDSKNARECGDSLATFLVNQALIDESGVTVNEMLKRELLAAITLKPKRDRLYLIFQKPGDGGWTGRFVFGNRRRPPWVGYAQATDEDASDE